MKYEHDQKEKELALFKEARNHMEHFLKTNFVVDSIGFSDDYFIDPLGGVTVKGHTDGKQEFEGLYDPDNKEILSYTVDAEPKEECKDKLCTR
ncbi:hypothetical protein AAGG74_15015 [Bacillus mexicanus]|uniref:DUF1433 domain-containing protein n=1 Tax=Bacillus mexicanus TaxID=2834415 RepID=UPI003D1F825C